MREGFWAKASGWKCHFFVVKRDIGLYSLCNSIAHNGDFEETTPNEDEMCLTCKKYLFGKASNPIMKKNELIRVLKSLKNRLTKEADLIQIQIDLIEKKTASGPVKEGKA